MRNLERDPQNMWNFLGDSWASLTGRETVEKMWEAVASGIDLVMNKTMDVQNSRSFPSMPPTINDGPKNYLFVYSGINSNVTTASGGIFAYPLDNWTIEIPTLYQNYYVAGSGIEVTYYQDTDYRIDNMNTLVWLNTPAWDSRYTTVQLLNLSADTVTRVNPILMGSWARILGITFEQLLEYPTFGTNQYLHIKNLVWSLVHKRLLPSTIKNLRDGVGIAHGFPFAFEAGTITTVGSVDTTHIATVAGILYTLASGIDTYVDGTQIDKFSLLGPYVSVFDYYSNASGIMALSGINDLNKYNTLAINILNSQSTYNGDFYSSYVAGLLPVALNLRY